MYRLTMHRLYLTTLFLAYCSLAFAQGNPRDPLSAQFAAGVPMGAGVPVERGVPAKYLTLVLSPTVC